MLVIGFIFDADAGDQPGAHRAATSTSQVIPFGIVVRRAVPSSSPLIWESLSVTFVDDPGGASCVYRDDTGKSVAEKLAAKAKLFPDEAGARHVPA